MNRPGTSGISIPECKRGLTMTFFRKYFDESDTEEISEETAREVLADNYSDVDAAIDNMKRCHMLRLTTPSAWYWYKPSTGGNGSENGRRQ
jgi:hypothetical protein